MLPQRRGEQDGGIVIEKKEGSEGKTKGRGSAHLAAAGSLIDAAANSNPPCPTEARLVASRSGASSGAAANAHCGRAQW
uniref:DUF834 domain-containing protein n=1 Tax=Oryza punctata TaxID=4537 RepID=A0A0E0MIJ9_ORYPU